MSDALKILQLFDRKRRAYRSVYASPAGKAVLEDIIAVCRTWRGSRETDRDGRIDPYAMAMNQGAREIASHIVRHLGVSDLEMQLRMKQAQTAGERPEE